MSRGKENEVLDQQKIQRLRRSIEKIQSQKVVAKKAQEKLLEELEIVTRQNQLNHLKHGDQAKNGEINEVTQNKNQN